MIANPALTMERECRSILSERSTLDPFEALAGETPVLQHDRLERQSFLARERPNRPPRLRCAVAPLLRSGRRHSGQLGADMLMLAATKNLAAQDRRPPTSRSIRCTPHKLLVAIRRATGDHVYQLLKGGLTRPQPTVIRVSRSGAHWRRRQFSWINKWPELAARSGRCHGVAFLVPARFCQGVLDRLLVPLSCGGEHRSGTAHRQEREP
jgi:plasmid replication initiation protein